ncbi:hypothetical protein HNY73_007445 [Argiope bruennichi]|uniref:Endonuclease/exonuclease/phosphatase domain-containing protein n=1 Tax=Argiope bruennichi TaxID=94029 RepID=A0A8T0FGJ3_ARGBR|nr:hypothetical protein HNY73_007445 [Argiope bruennichi]
MENIWYVPDVKRHLFSVQQATKHGGEVKMTKTHTEFFRNEELVAVGSWRDGTYIMSMRVVSPASPAEISIATETESLQLWHERLGQQNKRHIPKLITDMGISPLRSGEVDAHSETFFSRWEIFSALILAENAVRKDSVDLGHISVGMSCNISETLQDLDVLLKSIGTEMALIGADLNAHSRIWGYRDESARGSLVEDLIAANHLFLM